MAGLTSSALAESPVLMKDTFSLMWQVLLLLQLICTLTLVFSELHVAWQGPDVFLSKILYSHTAFIQPVKKNR